MIDGSMRRRTVGERRADARRRVGLAGLERRLGGDDRFDRLLRVGGAAERQQAEGAVLFDRARLAGGMLRRAQAVQHRQRIVIGGGGVQVARGGEVGVLGAAPRAAAQDGARDERGERNRLSFFPQVDAEARRRIERDRGGVALLAEFRMAEDDFMRADA